MNPEMQKELTEWLGTLREGAKQGKDFVLEQAPLVLREAVILGRAENTIYVLSALIVMALVALFLRWVLKQDWDEIGRQDDMKKQATIVIGSVVSLLAALIAFVVIVTYFHYVLTAWFAPRIYLIEYLADLMKTTK